MRPLACGRRVETAIIEALHYIAHNCRKIMMLTDESHFCDYGVRDRRTRVECWSTDAGGMSRQFDRRARGAKRSRSQHADSSSADFGRARHAATCRTAHVNLTPSTVRLESSTIFPHAEWRRTASEGDSLSARWIGHEKGATRVAPFACLTDCRILHRWRQRRGVLRVDHADDLVRDQQMGGSGRVNAVQVRSASRRSPWGCAKFGNGGISPLARLAANRMLGS